jgi:hypothetical protein
MSSTIPLPAREQGCNRSWSNKHTRQGLHGLQTTPRRKPCRARVCSGTARPAQPITGRLCVFITAVPLIKLFAWGEGESGGHVLRDTGTREEPGALTQGGALFSWFLSVGNRTRNSRVAGARPNHQPIGGSDPNHQGSPPGQGRAMGPVSRVFSSVSHL